MPGLRHGISLGVRYTNSATKPDRLDSPLLLSWAAHAGGLSLYQDAHNTPGLAKLLAATSNMTWLCTLSGDVLAAARTDHLISKCCPRRLDLCSPCPPSVLPETTEELLAEFCTDSVEGDFDPRQVDALLYHCTRLPRLRWLRLNLGFLQPVLLTCTAQLRWLDHLDVELSLGEDCEADLIVVGAWTALRSPGIHSRFAHWRPGQPCCICAAAEPGQAAEADRIPAV